MTKRILWIGDAVVPTGFSTVNTNIIKNLSAKKFEVHHLGVNYFGDPHPYPWKIYPAATKGDIWGFGRLPEFAAYKWDVVFILNDAWVINKYLEKIRKYFTNVPKIVVYFPVDSHTFDSDWFDNFDIVSETVVYTQFGKDVVSACRPNLELEIIPHGIDFSLFHKLDLPKREIKAKIYPKKEEFLDSFVVLNASRNQPRKRLDISLEAFKLFSEGKPENVKYYHHAGLKDAGWAIDKLINRYDLSKRFIITNRAVNLQTVDEAKLNLIYNATDVGLNTSIGEGWCLPCHEHAVTGAPQVVPDHSALRELYYDCGILVPTSSHQTNVDQLTVSYIVKPEDVAEKLNNLYYDPGTYESLSQRSILKLTGSEYSWKNIAKRWEQVFNEVLE